MFELIDFLTSGAFHVTVHEGAKRTVVEFGMGGRLDSTHVLVAVPRRRVHEGAALTGVGPARRGRTSRGRDADAFHDGAATGARGAETETHCVAAPPARGGRTRSCHVRLTPGQSQAMRSHPHARAPSICAAVELRPVHSGRFSCISSRLTSLTGRRAVSLPASFRDAFCVSVGPNVPGDMFRPPGPDQVRKRALAALRTPRGADRLLEADDEDVQAELRGAGQRGVNPS